MIVSQRTKEFSNTSGPSIARGKIIQGLGGCARYGPDRCFISAYDAATGKPLWHAGLGTNTSNGPQTYLLDGRQYIVVGAGDSLYAFALHQ